MCPYPRYILLHSLYLLVKLGCIALLLQYDTSPPLSFFFLFSPSNSRRCHKYPRNQMTELSLGPSPHVGSRHYQLSGPAVDAEWAALAPHGCTCARTAGPTASPSSTSCAASIHPPRQADQHCLNHVWQGALSRGSRAGPRVLAGRGRSARRECGRADTNLCVDWRRVYEELEKDQQEYARWAAEHHQNVCSRLETECLGSTVKTLERDVICITV
ncbi:hypothetical protein BC826DRAFT_942455 [Russula brevipes]|nr:hypothetical protein BC826DRAFT_942455 [Russula brevipes]